MVNNFLDKFNTTYAKATNIVASADNIGSLFGIDVSGALGLTSSSRRTDQGFNIDKFKATIDDVGYQKTNLFMVHINIPKTLRGKGFGSGDTSLPYLPMLCFASPIPGVHFLTEEIFHHGYGQYQKMPYLPSFNELQLQFIVDGEGILLEFFQMWVNSIVNFDTTKGMGSSNFSGLSPYEIQYQKDYVVNIELATFNQIGDKIFSYDFSKCYPVGIEDINMNWGSTDELATLGVRMQFKEYTPSFFPVPTIDADTGLSLIQQIQKGATIVQTVSSLSKPQSISDIVNVVNNAKLVKMGLGL